MWTTTRSMSRSTTSRPIPRDAKRSVRHAHTTRERRFFSSLFLCSLLFSSFPSVSLSSLCFSCLFGSPFLLPFFSSLFLVPSLSPSLALFSSLLVPFRFSFPLLSSSSVSPSFPLLFCFPSGSLLLLFFSLLYSLFSFSSPFLRVIF